MIDRHFAILAAMVTVTGSAGYALDTLRGRTEPNRVSWPLWAIAPLIAFAAELSEGVGIKGLMTFGVGLGPGARGGGLIRRRARLRAGRPGSISPARCCRWPRWRCGR